MRIGSIPLLARHQDTPQPVSHLSGGRARAVATQALFSPSDLHRATAQTNIVSALRQLGIELHDVITQHIDRQLTDLSPVARKALALALGGQPIQTTALADALGCFPPALSQHLGPRYQPSRTTVAQNFLATLPTITADELATLATQLRA